MYDPSDPEFDPVQLELWDWTSSKFGHVDGEENLPCNMPELHGIGFTVSDRIQSTTPGAEPPRHARDSGSARSHSTHQETSSSDRP